jgi:2-deoxy-D-gluconate 3-dehydrogenase
MIDPSPVAGFDLTGRAILVTGAGRGLGRGMAAAVAAAGASVVAVARTRADLEETSLLAPDRIRSLVWDVAELDRADDLIQAATDLVGPLNGVVHAAGIQRRAPAVDFSVESWKEVTNLDLDAPFFISTALQRSVEGRSNPCSHVFVGSLTSSIGIAGISAYGASKSGLLGVVRTLAVEWAASGTRVNCLAPGYFKTTLTAGLLDDPEKARWVMSRTPMGRLGTPEDLAGPLIFLLSDASAFMTGQVLYVDGGWLAA